MRGAALLAAALAAGCTDKLSTPSAYEEQRYLCDPSYALQLASEVEACSNDKSCAGVVSFKGSLQGSPVTVESKVAIGQYIVVANGSSGQLWDQVLLNGASPYFNFVFYLKSLGGTVDSSPDEQRILRFNAAAPAQPNALSDDQIEGGMLLQAAGGSVDLRAMTNSGSVVLTKLASTELVGSFHGEFGGTNDVVDGCFHMFPSQIIVNPAPGQ